MRLQLGICCLLRERLRPVQGEIEVTATVVEFTGAARWRLAVIEQFASRLVECRGENLGLVVVILVGNVFELDRQGEEFAERIPAQVIFLNQLFHVLGCRTAGPGLEQRAAGHERDD